MHCVIVALAGSFVMLVRLTVAAPFFLAMYAGRAAYAWYQRRKKRVARRRYCAYVDALRPLRLPHYVVLKIADLAEPTVDATEDEKLRIIDRQRRVN